MAVVSLEHIGKRYDTGAPILSDVSLNLEPGGFYFLTGASGAGKTTLLRIIHLAERPSRGRLRLFATDTAALERQVPAPKRVGSPAMSSRSTVETSRASDESALSRRGTLGPGVARLHH